MRKMNTDPNRNTLYGNLKNVPIDQLAAIKELIDNSMDAEARNIEVVLLYETLKSRLVGYMVIDDGGGMDKNLLEKSFTFCTDAIHTDGDTGKFGLGGTSAAFYLGKFKKTWTKTKWGKLLVAKQDLEKSTEAFELDVTPDDERLFNRYCSDQGTIICIKELEGSETSSASSFAKRLVKDVGETYHLKMPLLNIKVTRYNVDTKRDISTVVSPVDPLNWTEPEKLDWFQEKSYTYDGHDFTVRLVMMKDIYDGKITGRTLAQGIYACREGRLIAKACSNKNLWTKNSRLNQGRVMFSFTSKLDDAMKVSVFKDGFKPIQAIVDMVRPDILQLKSRIQKRYDRDTAKESSQSTQDNQTRLDELTAAMEAKGGSIGALKKPAHGKGTEKGRVDTKNSRRSKNPKGSGPPRASPRCGRIIPKFRLIDFGAHSEHHLSFDIDDENLVVELNTRSPVYSKEYNLAPANGKRMLELEWGAAALTLYDTYMRGETDFEVIHDFLNKVALTRTQMSKHLV